MNGHFTEINVRVSFVLCQSRNITVEKQLKAITRNRRTTSKALSYNKNEHLKPQLTSDSRYQVTSRCHQLWVSNLLELQ